MARTNHISKSASHSSSSSSVINKHHNSSKTSRFKSNKSKRHPNAKSLHSNIIPTLIIAILIISIGTIFIMQDGDTPATGQAAYTLDTSIANLEDGDVIYTGAGASYYIEKEESTTYLYDISGNKIPLSNTIPTLEQLGAIQVYDATQYTKFGDDFVLDDQETINGIDNKRYYVQSDGSYSTTETEDTTDQATSTGSDTSSDSSSGSSGTSSSSSSSSGAAATDTSTSSSSSSSEPTPESVEAGVVATDGLIDPDSLEVGDTFEAKLEGGSGETGKWRVSEVTDAGAVLEYYDKDASKWVGTSEIYSNSDQHRIKGTLTTVSSTEDNLKNQGYTQVDDDSNIWTKENSDGTVTLYDLTSEEKTTVPQEFIEGDYSSVITNAEIKNGILTTNDGSTYVFDENSVQIHSADSNDYTEINYLEGFDSITTEVTYDTENKPTYKTSYGGATYDEVKTSGSCGSSDGNCLLLDSSEPSDDGSYSSSVTTYQNGDATSKKIRSVDSDVITETSVEYSGGKAVSSSGSITYGEGTDEKQAISLSFETSYDEESGENIQIVTNDQGDIIAYSEVDKIDDQPVSDPKELIVMTKDGKVHGVLAEGVTLEEALEDGEITEGELKEEGKITCDADGCKDTGGNAVTSTVAHSLASQQNWKIAWQSQKFEALTAAIGELGSGAWYSQLIFNNINDGQSLARWDRWFAGSVLSENYWESLICQSKYPDIQESGVSFIETPAGTFQGVGSVNGEVSYVGDPQELLCYPDEDGVATCPVAGYECMDDTYCIDENEEILTGYRYKITWGVTAPSDEALTPYVNENGYAVNYNIVVSSKNSDNYNDNCQFNLPSCVRLYTYQGDNSHPLQLLNGESDGQVLVLWSTRDDYKSVCLDWGQAPLTVSYAGGAGNLPSKSDLGRESGGSPIPTLCMPIAKTRAGSVDASQYETYSQSVSSGAYGSSSSADQSVTTGQATIADLS